MGEYVDVVAAAGSLEIEVTGGPGAGQQFSVHEDFRVGSGETGPGTLGGDRWLSASHALFHRGPDGWAVEDLRSLEGTSLNGRPLRGAATLAPGDVVELGSSRIVVLPNAGTSAASLHASSAPGMAEVRRAENRRELDGKRVIAFLIDTLVPLPPLIVVYELGRGRALVWLAIAALTLTYFFLCEALTGRTLGKRIAGLRVVRVDGRPLNPRSVAGRTVLRIVDQQLGALVGMLTMILTGQRRQRLGDLAARTAVTRASAPFPPIAPRRGWERIAIWGYPAMWLAPIVLLFVLFPDARLTSCQDAGISAGSSSEGDCVLSTRAGSGVFQVVNTGHTLRLPGVNVTLVRTRTRQGPGGVLAVGFELAVQNTGDRPVRFDADSRHVILTAPRPDGLGEGAAREILVSARARVAPGGTRLVWASFAVPPEVLPGLREPHGGGLVLMPGVDGLPRGGCEHLGEIRLWDAANSAGVRALSGLRD